MHIHTSSHISGSERVMTVTLRGDDDDFIGLIDEGAGRSGVLGVLAAKVAEQTGLIAERADDRANAARLLRRAAEILERDTE